VAQVNPCASTSALLKVDSVVRRFGGLTAVNQVSFEVRQGEIVGLIGPNGAGKTTLFNIISGHLSANEGRVEFDGRDMTNRRPPLWAKAGVGRTFQIVKPLKSLSVLENAMVGALLKNNKAVARERAAAIVERVGMGALMHQPAGSLTLESRKRLELARALSVEPKLLLLDEILAGLNASEVEESIHLIRSLAEVDGLAVIMIEHNLHAVMSLAQRVVVLDYGVKIAEDLPEVVVRHPKVVAAYLGSDDE